MIDKIKIEDDSLAYIEVIALGHCLDVEEDNDGNVCGVNPSDRSIYTFKSRYEDDKLKSKFTYSTYSKNTDIQATLLGLALDPVKFWFLLLYIYDYCNDIFVDSIKLKDSAKDQINNFLNAIEANAKAIENGSFVFEEPIKITLEIGKKKITIDNATAISHLAVLGAKDLDNMNTDSRLNSHTITKSDEQNHTKFCYFAEVLKSFLNLDFIPNKRSKDSTISYSKTLLISRLIYFTGLYTDDKLLNSDDTLKGYMNLYKDHKVKNIHNIYL